MTRTIADMDIAVRRLNMAVVELDRGTWNRFVAELANAEARADGAEHELDAVRNLMARADIHQREQYRSHALTSERAAELAGQHAQVVATLRNVLGDPTNPAHRATAAGLLHQAAATTRNPR